MKYILKNAYFPFDNQIKDIYVEAGIVKDIGHGLNVESATVIDLEKRMVIDGFVDGHMHLDKALIADKISNKSGTLEEAISIMSNYKPEMSKEDIENRARKVLDMALAQGTRYARTHVDVDESAGLKSMEVLLKLREEYKEKINIQIVAFPQEGIVESKKSYAYLDEALKLGADVVGGIPAIEKDPLKHMEMIFNLALKYDVDIDMHVDETDDPKSLTLRDLAKMTIDNDYEGRVTAGHCCSLAANPKDKILPIIELVKEARIGIISLPSTNLYLQGRGDSYNVRRGITPVKFLVEEGVNVLIGSDNIRDPFNPFGNSNLLEELLIAAHGVHMGGEKDLNKLFDMISIVPGKVLGFDYGIREGKRANFVVVNASNKASAIIGQVGMFGYFEEGKFKTNE